MKDANGNEATLAGSGVTLKDANGNRAELTSSGITSSGAKLVIDAPSVMLGGSGGEPVLKGSSFLSAFGAHPSVVGRADRAAVPTGSEMTALPAR